MKNLVSFINEKLSVNKDSSFDVLDMINDIFANSTKNNITHSSDVNFQHLLEDIIDEHIQDDTELYEESVKQLEKTLKRNSKLSDIEKRVDTAIQKPQNSYFNWWYDEDPIASVEELVQYANKNFNKKDIIKVDLSKLIDLNINVVDLNEYVLVWGSTYDLDLTALLIFRGV